MKVLPFTLYEPIAMCNAGPLWYAEDSAGTPFAAMLLTDPDNEGWIDRLQRQTLISHRNLATARRVHRLKDGRIAVLFPYISGHRLDLVCLAAAPTAAQLRGLGITLCEALTALHAKGVAHGDISPTNIMLDSQGQLVLVDFISLPTENGTPGFSAPERAVCPEPASDVYSLVKTLIHYGLDREPFGDFLHPAPGIRPSLTDLASILHGLGGTQKWQMPRIVDIIAAEKELEGQPIKTAVDKSPAGGRHRHSLKRPVLKLRKEHSFFKHLTIFTVCCATAFAAGMGVHGLLREPSFAVSAPQDTAVQDFVPRSVTTRKPNFPPENVKMAAPKTTAVKIRAIRNPEAALQNLFIADSNIEDNDQALKILSALLGERDRALEALDIQSLGRISVRNSDIWRNDRKLLAKLRAADTRARGLRTAIDACEITGGNGSDIRLKVSLRQLTYTRVRGSSTHPVAMQAPKILAVTLRSKPWRLLSAADLEVSDTDTKPTDLP